MKHKYSKGRADLEKGIPVVSIHTKVSKTSVTSGAVAVASRPQPPSTAAQAQRTSAAPVHNQKPNAAATTGGHGEPLHSKSQSTYGKLGRVLQPLSLISISKEATADVRGGAAMAGVRSARAGRDGAASKESTMKPNQLAKQQKLFVQYKGNEQDQKEPGRKAQDQSGEAHTGACRATAAGDQQHHVYMKKRMARRGRNAAARKSLSQNTADVGHKTRQEAPVDGQLGSGGKVPDSSAAGPMADAGAGATQDQSNQRSPETVPRPRQAENFSHRDAAPSQSSLAGDRGRAGTGVVMQYQNMLIGDQSGGHLTHISSSNVSKSYTRQTHQTAGKESRTGKSAITNPSGRENVVETTQNDDPASSYRQSCHTALRNFSNADLSATVLRKGRGPNSRKEAGPSRRGDVQHFTVFNHRFPQVDARGGHQSQLQLRNLNQRLQNDGQSSYEDIRRTAGADELLRQQLPRLPNTRGRNTGNRSQLTQQQASHVPIRSVNIGLTENPSSCGGRPTNNVDRHSGSQLTIGLPSAASQAGVPPVFHIRGSKEPADAAHGAHIETNLLQGGGSRAGKEEPETDREPGQAIEIQDQQAEGQEARGDAVAEDDCATGTGKEVEASEGSRSGGGRPQPGGQRRRLARNQAGKSRSQVAQGGTSGGLTSVQSKLQKY